MKMRNWLMPLALLAVTAHAGQAQEQRSLAVVGAFQGYFFPEQLGVKSATLFIVPVGYMMQVSRSLSFDLYTAYARGDVKTGTQTQTMQGMVDTHVRATLNVAPWAAITASLNLPTGNATHDSEEAIVATALSTELLGFREALWGTGFGATTGIATAWRAGSTGIGFGASYRLATEFEPSSDQDLKYTPGNEMRARFAVDQNFGASKLTFGLTFQNYSDDRANGRDLFAPGNRWRGDVTYSFRTSPTSTWSIYAADVWRENGDVFLQVVDGGGAVIRDSSFVSGQQNLAVVGIAGSVGRLRPVADFRLLARESGSDEGWLGSVGSEILFRKGSMDVVPSFRASYGQIEDASDTRHGFWGGALSLTLRWSSR